jgi:VanZ family protein
MRRWTRLRAWLPAVAWAAVISLASTDALSADHTSRILFPVLHWLFPHAASETLDQMQLFIRKTAHLSEYFAFSYFLLRGLRGKDRGWRWRWAIWAIAIAAGYSALDEFHQSFVPSRTASPWDSLIDTTGAAAAQIFLGLWAWLHAQGWVKSLGGKTPAK